MWWAVVTIMTVGYGDTYSSAPTETLGYFVGVMTMVFSLVIMALPVGVIGGNFSQAWNNFLEEKILEAKEHEMDVKFITSAKQRTPALQHEMSKIMLVEVWNRRQTDKDQRLSSMSEEGDQKIQLAHEQRRPDQAEFMGLVDLRLDLGQDDPDDPYGGGMDRARSITETLTLRPQSAEKHKVNGKITVRYEWTPLVLDDDKRPAQPIATENSTPSPPPPLKANGSKRSTKKFRLTGRLKVTLVSAENLVNLNYVPNLASNPYCIVYVYPQSPSPGGLVCPAAWRSPSECNTLSPKWSQSLGARASCTWDYVWLEAPDEVPPFDLRRSLVQLEKQVGEVRAEISQVRANASRLSDAIIPPPTITSP
jgi:hypothetical protein